MPGLPCQVSTDGVSLIPTLELKGNSVEGLHHPWICISKILGVLTWWMPNAGDCVPKHGMPPRWRSSPSLVEGGVGENQIGKKGWAELGDGVAASVVAGKGAINPSGIPPMVWCGWEG